MISESIFANKKKYSYYPETSQILHSSLPDNKRQNLVKSELPK